MLLAVSTESIETKKHWPPITDIIYGPQKFLTDLTKQF